MKQSASAEYRYSDEQVEQEKTMQKRKSLPAIYPFIVVASPHTEEAFVEGLRYLPDAQGYLYQRRFEYDPDSEENAYERVFDDVWESMPAELRDKDRIVLMGFSWDFISGVQYQERYLSRGCMVYRGYDEETFGNDPIRAIQKEIPDWFPAAKVESGFEELKVAPSEDAMKDDKGNDFGFAIPPDLHAYCNKKGYAPVIYTSAIGALSYFMEVRREEMKPPWLYCGVRRRLVAKRRETMYAKEIESVLTLFRKKGIRTKPGMAEVQIVEAEKCFGIMFANGKHFFQGFGRQNFHKFGKHFFQELGRGFFPCFGKVFFP